MIWCCSSVTCQADWADWGTVCWCSPDWWINEGSTDTDYMDWYWLISPEMSKLLDQWMIIHIQYDDTIWWRIGGSSCETKKYTRWINMLSDSLLHRTLLVFLLKCLVQPIWEMFIYIYMYIYVYIFETWNHQADDCNTWPSNIEILPIKSILSQKNNRLCHVFYRNSTHQIVHGQVTHETRQWHWDMPHFQTHPNFCTVFIHSLEVY
jgi:hypothetical protein